jgi:L-alanine-DL-glutamate epimerase-like enolase superfamily enzyme
LYPPIKLDLTIESWQMVAPLKISGHVMRDLHVLVAEVSDGEFRGRGEATGLFYFGDRPLRMRAAIEQVRGAIEGGASRADLRELMPPGGARNAVDCALWELESKRAGRSVEHLAGLEACRPLRTTLTIGADSPQAMAHVARCKYRDAEAIKLKLLGDALDGQRVSAVRAARPDVWLGVDGNQGFTVDHFHAVIAGFVEARVALIEQPFKAGQESLLAAIERPIPIAADESVQSLKDMHLLPGRFDVLNIKLDKCGGLTEALLMADEARRMGLGVMVGNMGGTSLAMAPALVVGQRCDVVDLDGPLFLTADRRPGVLYQGGKVSAPPGTWGYGGHD